MRRVLVTGGNGFIGSHVCLALQVCGITPVVFDRRYVVPTTGYTQHLGDVRDHSDVNESISQVDGVIHLAGVLGTQETVNDPIPAVETNVLGALNVFQACRVFRKPCTYITVGNHWMLNSYSTTKTTAERFAWMFNIEHGTRIAVVRALNAYGPGQKSRPVRKIIPTLCLAALHDEPLPIYGDGTQIMDMIHVRDVADVLVRALVVDHGNYRTPFEAGTGRLTTVNAIADAVRTANGRWVRAVHLPMRPGEPAQAVVMGNPETLRPLYDDAVPSFITLEDGLAETVAYYKERLSDGTVD